MREIILGTQNSKSEVVVKEKLASFVGSGNIDVYATPMMIALMEGSASECLSQFLDDNETSVGINISSSHVKASKLGNEVTAKCEITAVDGKKVSFSIEAFDGDTLIGKGEHDRFIVDIQKFMARL